MKKNVFILIVGLQILFACKDDTFINEHELK